MTKPKQRKGAIATPEDILFGPLPKYRKVVIVTNGKHSPTYQTVPSHEPPSKEDVALPSSHNRPGMPTGC